MKYYYWKSKEDGQWYWHLKATNGRIICQSEGYKRASSVLKTITSIQQTTTAQVIPK